MENSTMYVNVNAVMDIVECMYQASDNYHERMAFDAVQDHILDLPWKEIKEAEEGGRWSY